MYSYFLKYYFLPCLYININMTRREILRYTAFATGAAVSAPLASALLVGCQSDFDDNYLPEFFEEEEFDVIKHVMNTILPKTDSPSAIQAGTHQVLDKMLLNVYEEADQLEFRTGFTTLKTYLTEATGGKTFDRLSEKQQLSTLKNLEQSEDEALEAVREAYLNIKQQTIAYYLSSEVIGTQFLNYLPVPGEYEACISVAEAGGKAWTL